MKTGIEDRSKEENINRGKKISIVHTSIYTLYVMDTNCIICKRCNTRSQYSDTYHQIQC